MAFSSPSSSNSAPASSSWSWKYDVFLSFRGEDTRKNFVDHLHSALTERLIRVYKDDETLPRGDSIGQSLLKAIEESQFAIIVFSKNYADSSWCLDELAYIMKCKDKRGLIVMPIFYDVDPSQVRKQQGDFGEAFSKQEVKNINKVESWRKALVDTSNIAGWEPKNIANGHESKFIKEIVGEIQDRLFPLDSNVDEELVGMRERLQDLISQVEIGTGGVRMVGIWGIGGSGKTTLASSVYTHISRHFQGHCIVSNIREASSKHGLETLQQKILSTVLKTRVEVQSVEEGKRIMKSRLCNSKVLVVLDDVNDLDQLKALVGSHKWFGGGSRIIITTRDEHLLRTHRVDHISLVKLLSDEEAIRLFYKHAYNETEPLTDYETLSLRVVSYAAGLPLAIKVLGSFLFDKDENEWISALAKLKDIPNIKIMDVLQISYDGLETLQKELFLDIACFFRWKNIDDAMEILDACGFHPVIEIKVLRQKALITTTDGKFDMHDLVQEMGHYIVRGEHPNNPEKHSRVWNNEEISNMCYRDSTMENDKIEAMRYYGHSSRLYKFISNMKNLRCLSVVMYVGDERDKHTEGPSFLSNELRYLYWERYPASPFPDSFQPMNLVVLKLHYSLQKELWNGCKCLPHLKVLQLCFMRNLLSTPDFDGLPCLETLILRYCDKLKEIHPSLGNRRSLEYRRPHLKVLQLWYMESLLSTPDFNGLPYLQKLEISNCDNLEEIHPSLGHHTSLEYVSVRSCKKLKMFPMIGQMKNLKILKIENCYSILELSKIQSDMESLVRLSMKRIHPSHGNCRSLEYRLPHLKVLQFCYMDNLLSTPDFNGLPYLQKLEISNCDNLEEIHPSLGNHTSVEDISVRSCDKLRMFPMIVQMKNLKTLEVENCHSIPELPKIQSNMESLVRLSMKRIRKNMAGFLIKHGKLGEVVYQTSVEECSTQLEPVFHQFTRKLNLSSLQKLHLCGWGLKDGEIPFDIGELYNLEELNLSRNDISVLGFSLSQLTRLKILILSECKWLVELPELPSSIAVLEADKCYSLKSIGGNHPANFKWLCKVSLVAWSWARGRVVNDVGRLLESMVEGMGIGNHCMVFRCEGLEIPNRFLHSLVIENGHQCILQLPENWGNEFCGFVMCAVANPLSYKIRMEKVMNSEMRSYRKYDDVALEEKIVGGIKRTWVGFVSFASLRHTSWWDETQTALFVSFEHEFFHCEGFGIDLVPKKSEIAPTTETSTDDLAFPRLNILHDSTSALTIEFCFNKVDNPVSDDNFVKRNLK